jgi:tRNA A37 N6-isopentenylltransferase MiaA
MSRREWNTPIREPWNPVIHNILKAIDNHTAAYIQDRNLWHLNKAQELREYVTELKGYIYSEESNRESE